MKRVLKENEIIEAMNYILENDESTKELADKQPCYALLFQNAAYKVQAKIGQAEVDGVDVSKEFARVTKEDEYIWHEVMNTPLLLAVFAIVQSKAVEHIFPEYEEGERWQH